MKLFENKVVIITWWTSGIWAASVKKFAEHWATVYFTGRNADKWQVVSEATGATFMQVDATDLEATKSFIEKVWTDHGTIDVLYLNAGSAKAVDILETNEEIFDFTYDLNVKSPVMSIQYALPFLKEWSSITITASVAWQAGFRGFNIYGSTKAAVINIAKTYAGALAEKWIRVNTVSPGPIDTDIFAAVWIPAEQVDGTKQFMWNLTPMKRMWTADEIANTVAFLSSHQASYITWSDIIVDGGMIPVKL